MLDLMKIFENVNGSSFVGIDTRTIPALNKKHNGGLNPHFGAVVKYTAGNSVMCFQNKKTNAYENMVHRRLIAEGKDPKDFVLGERKWGTRIPDTPFIRHEKDGVEKFYLEVIFLHPGTTVYLYNSLEIAKSDIIGLREAAVDDEAQGGLGNQVVIRSFAFESITGVRIDSERYS